jgi:hypothetical protein
MAIDVLSKEEMLSGLTISMYPHLKETRRKKIFSELQRGIKSMIDREPNIKGYGEVIDNIKRKLGRG